MGLFDKLKANRLSLETLQQIERECLEKISKELAKDTYFAPSEVYEDDNRYEKSEIPNAFLPYVNGQTVYGSDDIRYYTDFVSTIVFKQTTNYVKANPKIKDSKQKIQEYIEMITQDIIDTESEDLAKLYNKNFVIV